MSTRQSALNHVLTVLDLSEESKKLLQDNAIKSISTLSMITEDEFAKLCKKHEDILLLGYVKSILTFKTTQLTILAQV